MIRVFVSRPTTLTVGQARFVRALERVLSEAGLELRTVGVTDFGNRAPLHKVREVMSRCEGALVLGLTQFHVETGTRKAGTRHAERVTDIRLATTWNQLEAGIAYERHLPLFVIRETTVAPEGIFDAQVGDHFVHHADVGPRWLRSQSFLQPFREWLSEIETRRASRDRGAAGRDRRRGGGGDAQHAGRRDARRRRARPAK